jgi:hypothetical protein
MQPSKFHKLESFNQVCLVTKAMMNILPCTLPKIRCQACDSTKNHLIGGHGTLLLQGYI